MATDVRYTTWFAGGIESQRNLSTSTLALALEGFALAASAVVRDCQEHALARIHRASASASTYYSQVAGGATRSFLELVYQPERPIDPRPLLATHNDLLALRHAVAFMYCELDGGTFSLAAQSELS